MDLGHLLILVLGIASTAVVSRRADIRRRRDKSLLDEERLFLKTLLDNITDGVVACDTEGVLTLFNQASQEIHGLPQESITSEHWANQYDLYEPDGRTRLAIEEIPLFKAWRGEKVVDQEIVIAPKGGTAKLVRATGQAMVGPDGRRAGAVVTMRDVSEEKKAEEQWRQAHQIIENSNCILFKWRNDDQWSVEYVTENVSVFGYEAERFTSQRIRFSDIVHPEDLERVQTEVREHAERGTDQFMQSYRILDRFGTTRWVEDWTVVVHGVGGEITHYHGFIIDVTDRETISELLRSSEERMQLAMRAADLGLWDWDVKTDTVIYNDRWAEMLGYRLDEIATEYSVWKSLMNTEDMPATLAVIQRHMDGETENFTSEFRMRHKDGHWVWIQARGQVMERDAEGAPLRVAGTHLDISDRIEAEREHHTLESKMQQAQKLESLGVLAGGIAHDFNNILMAILGNAELARLDLDEASTTSEFLHEIESASERAADLCNQMLAYSGKGRFEVRPLNLSSAVRDIARMLSVSISKTVTLNFDLAEELPTIEADVTQIRQVIMNLITNASEAIGDQPGTITLSTRATKRCPCDSFDPATPCTRQQGPCILLEVRDTGCGMDETTLKRLFEPFYTTKFTGRGLGMAAVLGIIHGHKGEIHVESRPGEGTSIKVRIPVAKDYVELEIENTDEPMRIDENTASGTILVVDDEEAVLKLTSRILEHNGWRVETAVDGVEGVDAVRRLGEELSCVLLDITMPRMGGIEAQHMMRELQPDLPIIMSSGYNESEIVNQVDAKVGFIQKPFRKDQLLAVISQTLQAEVVV